MVSTPITMLSVAKYAPLFPSGALYDRFTEEEKSRCGLTDGSACYAVATQKWTAASFQPLSATTLEDTGKGTSSQGSKLRAVHTVICFLCKDKWPDMQLFTDP